MTAPERRVVEAAREWHRAVTWRAEQAGRAYSAGDATPGDAWDKELAWSAEVRHAAAALAEAVRELEGQR